jgi:hypothetical protein
MVVSAPAWGATEAEAEHIRLEEEMRRLASRNAWRGVEAKYNQMKELEKKGVVLTAEDHLLGVQAALQLGSVYDVYLRLQAANVVSPSPDLQGQIDNIAANYGLVKLDVDDKFKEEFPFKTERMPMDPFKRTAIETAQKRVAEERKFIGMLPNGRYTLGPQTFDVTKDAAERVEVYLGPVRRGRNGSESVAVRERQGLRLDVGPHYTVFGPTELTTTAADGVGGGTTLNSKASSSIGGRAGLGYEFFMTKGWSLALQGGWHGSWAGTSDSNDDPLAGARVNENTLGIFSLYGWVAPTWYYDDLAITAGPTFSFARVETASKDDPPVPLQATLTTGGGAISVFYGLFDTPGLSNSRSGFSAAAGVFASKSMMTFPWAQVAFTVAPEG